MSASGSDVLTRVGIPPRPLDETVLKGVRREPTGTAPKWAAANASLEKLGGSPGQIESGAIPCQLGRLK